ncbi:hypothetical protein ACO0LG_10110 [Undibacterium sp. Ji42W]|uniref:hypothetical protein n=1 Tax=Undibacterium sp. Ji42W TaxID=3413039 RepID=UPI003BF0418F
MRNFFGFNFSTKNQNISALNEQLVTSVVTVSDMGSNKKSKNLTSTTQHIHMKKLEEHRRNLRTMYFSS